MAAEKTLPVGYRECLRVDLQKDKKMAILVNVLALIICAVMTIIGCYITPISNFFNGNMSYFVWFLLGMFVYIVLHELVHGVFMRAFSKERPHYGFTGLYAYAGSNVYFDRIHYIIIALSPVVIWGVVFAVLCAVTEGGWFWVFYMLEIANISGAAGDFYVTWRFSKLPKGILIQDSGISMTVYTKE